VARVDPYQSFRFRLEIDGIIQGGFTECSGFGSSVDPVEYREGGDPATVRKLPGQAKYSDITLKWGITDSRELYNWHATALAGNPQRKNGSIVLFDHAGNEKVRWNFFQAWASKYDGPSLNATGNEVAIDSLTIVCERMDRAG
jgi:phage tail-like protein